MKETKKRQVNINLCIGSMVWFLRGDTGFERAMNLITLKNVYTYITFWHKKAMDRVEITEILTVQELREIYENFKIKINQGRKK